MIRRSTNALVGLALVAAARGGADPTAGEAASDRDPSAGACLEGTPDCADTDHGGGEDAPDGDGSAGGQAIDEAAILREAEELLGRTESEVLTGSDVRLGRHGDESMALTEDHVVGRRTIATEDDGTGTYRVVEVTVELTDGVQVLEAG
jgi:hypothetical protein